MRRTWLTLLLLAPVAAPGLLLAGAASGAEIVPHEARYEISLESLNIEGYPLSAEGAMAVRLSRDCQKWKTLQEIQFSVGIEGGQPINLHMMTRTLEGLDGTRMEFTGWKSQDGGTRTKLKGTAAMNRDGFGGLANFRQPEETEWDLPSPTQLPMAAMQNFLTALAGGQSAPQSIAFEVLGISEVTSVMTGKSVNLKKLETGDTALVKGRSWLVDRAVYFEGIAQNEPFMIETQQIHENGVVSKFWHDYRTMVLSGELVALTEIPIPAC
ncbi:MAG: DUF1849 family protein [Pseudomonadota bacterium]